MQLSSSLDCCTKKEIEENKKKKIVCDICNNTGWLLPNSVKKDHLVKEE